MADHGDFTMDYHNGEDGMRQNFIVRERPNGEGPLEVHLAYEGNLTAADKGGNAIVFCTPAEVRQGAAPAVWYKDLHVWDAEWRRWKPPSPCWRGMGCANYKRMRKAVYPVTVDPPGTAAIRS
ncbi:MAG: hypothetical protein IPF41_12350 [Flavobacteriales bacterium]|nr:hypothetical protein [Flavobacteriales bacterium]